jgi:hypothetical protein
VLVHIGSRRIYTASCATEQARYYFPFGGTGGVKQLGGLTSVAVPWACAHDIFTLLAGKAGLREMLRSVIPSHWGNCVKLPFCVVQWKIAPL